MQMDEQGQYLLTSVAATTTAAMAAATPTAVPTTATVAATAAAATVASHLCQAGIDLLLRLLEDANKITSLLGV